MNNKREMIKRLLALKGKTPDKYVIDTWYEILQKFSEKDLAKACNACLQKDGFFEIKQVLDELQPNNNDIAINEWNECMRIARAGSQGYDELASQTKKALRTAGGLNKLRFTESDYTKNNMREIFINVFNINKKEIVFDGKEYKFIENLSDKLSISQKPFLKGGHTIDEKI